MYTSHIELLDKPVLAQLLRRIEMKTISSSQIICQSHFSWCIFPTSRSASYTLCLTWFYDANTTGYTTHRH